MRFDDWPEVLDSVIESARHKLFSWGHHDCCLFAADAVLAMTGTDPAKSLRGEYETLRGALRIIDANGGMELMCDRLALAADMHRVAINSAKRGDIVLVENPLMDALGVVLGNVVACAGQDGIVFVQRSAIKKVWAV